MPDEQPRPPIGQRIARLYAQDTSFARCIVALGLVLLGVSMACGSGVGAPGYRILEEAFPLQVWGLLYLAVGVWGLYGVLNRLILTVRIAQTSASMYLWILLALAQFADQPLPTRMLLILPAIVDAWVLVTVVIRGKRGCKC